MIINNFLFEVVMATVDYYFLFLICDTFFKKKKRFPFAIFFLILCSACSYAFDIISGNNLFALFFDIFIVCLIVEVLFFGKFITKIIYSFSAYLLLGLLSTIFIAITAFATNINIDYIFNYTNERVIFLVVTKTILCIAILIWKNKMLQKFSSLDLPAHFKICMNVLLLISFIFVFILFSNIIITNDMQVKAYISMLSFFFFIIMIIVITILQLTSQIFEENNKLKIKSLLAEKKRNHFYEIENNQKEIRKIKHDMSNIFISIKILLERNQVAEVNNILSQRIKDLELITTSQQCGNYIIDSLLNYYISKNLDVNFKIEVTLTEPLIIRETDLIDLIGNAIENAVEATIKYNKINKKKEAMSITVKSVASSLILITENKFIDIKVSNDSFVTLKKDTLYHGIGLSSIKNVVEKHHGHMFTNTDNNTFILKVILENKCY